MRLLQRVMVSCYERAKSSHLFQTHFHLNKPKRSARMQVNDPNRVCDVQQTPGLETMVIPNWQNMHKIPASAIVFVQRK